MDHAICRGITKTIIDGLKDAQMQYDYAVAAKKQSDDTVESILWEYYDDWKEKLHRCISEFKL